MQLNDVSEQLSKIIENTVENSVRSWLEEKIQEIIEGDKPREMFMAYSLVPTKIGKQGIPKMGLGTDVEKYLEVQRADIHQVARIYLLVRLLQANQNFFAPKVAKIIQVADTGELVTFLKFLILLPDPGTYRDQAVDALRTNVTQVFNAIAAHNPYPARFFNEQQWNQMYLKMAFMQGDLSTLVDIDSRANAELARIISDYAHERWAASRNIDPYFWRPVTAFLSPGLLKDMQRLLESNDSLENRAAVLCCYHSGKPEAKELLVGYPEWVEQVKNKTLSWKTLKN